jgi:hypothetical protein
MLSRRVKDSRQLANKFYKLPTDRRASFAELNSFIA